MTVTYRRLLASIGWCCISLVTLALPEAHAQTDQSQFKQLRNGIKSFPNITNAWGLENISVHPMEISSGNFIRAFVPKGAIDPGTMKNRGLPRGGAGFKSVVFPSGVDRAAFSYWVRFPIGFDFVLGGKLPGLYGGKGNSGGKIPDGTDGFSFRLMWGKGGLGKVYAYLPTSVRYGTALFDHEFQFQPGQWHQIKQEVILNTPGKSDGIVRMWVDSQFLGEERDILMRTVSTLRINGMFFDVFFGGGDDRWAPKSDTHIDFSNFQLTF
tara:strand:+ start:351 stop:1154 length:804 start_codon:yes stop_codon:yes gene_type:complete